MQPYHFDVEIYSTDNVFSHEEAHIRKMISTNVAAIVSFPTYINSAELYNKIPERIHLSIVGPKPVGITRPYLISTEQIPVFFVESKCHATWPKFAKVRTESCGDSARELT